MGLINYSAEKEILVVARGHPFPKDALSNLFDALTDFRWSLVEQPAAESFFNPNSASYYSAFVCYDMPGIDFTATDDPPGIVYPSNKFKHGLLAMLDKGMGMVFLHHALAAWPAWDEFAEIIGGRFLYRPGMVRGRSWPDSGYRHDVTHNLTLTGEHPVTSGIAKEFELTDELYLCPIFTREITPILSSDYDFSCKNFYSAKLAVEGTMYARDGWSHPNGSNVVGWVKHYGRSPIVYLQGGDSGAVMEDPNFRRLVHNAVRWVSSKDALKWAEDAFEREKSAK